MPALPMGVGHSVRAMWFGALKSQFRRSRGYSRRSSTSSWSMRTMSNRVAAAAIASACVMAIPTIARAQFSPAELLVRIDRLENQIRQLTGEIERMQYRNQQLEATLNELRSGELASRGGSRLPAGPPPPYPPPQAGEGTSRYPPPLAGEGRVGAQRRADRRAGAIRRGSQVLPTAIR